MKNNKIIKEIFIDEQFVNLLRTPTSEIIESCDEYFPDKWYTEIFTNEMDETIISSLKEMKRNKNQFIINMTPDDAKFWTFISVEKEYKDFLVFVMTYKNIYFETLNEFDPELYNDYINNIRNIN